MGYISDNTRTRWGRRRPFIFWGAIAAGLLFALLWQLPRGQSDTFYFVFFLVGSILFFGGYTVFATPWVALGYELTPDYNERTRLMGTQNFIGQLAYVVSPWFLWIMNVQGILPRPGGRRRRACRSSWRWWPSAWASCRRSSCASGCRASRSPRRRSRNPGRPIRRRVQAQHGGLLQGIRHHAAVPAVPQALRGDVPGLQRLHADLLVPVLCDHLLRGGGDQELGAKYAGYAGTVGGVSTFAVVAFVTWLATRIGKRQRVLRFDRPCPSSAMASSGSATTRTCRCWPVLPAPLMAFGLGGLFTLMPSMIADVVDTDELKTHQRREGMFGSIFWWMVKLGLSAALAGGGYLLNATGFDVALGGGQAGRVPSS